jgi:hypothetical protein
MVENGIIALFVSKEAIAAYIASIFKYNSRRSDIPKAVS